MIDHINLYVSDLEKGKKFYSEALKSLGYGILREEAGDCGVGQLNGPNKWIGTLWLSEKQGIQPLHLAFRVKERAIVDQFYQDALKAGGTNNGEPSLRKHYHKNYYAAFVLDNDGHNIEVVSHEP